MNYREGSKVTLIIPAAHGQEAKLVNGTVFHRWDTGVLDITLDGDSDDRTVRIQERHVMDGWLA